MARSSSGATTLPTWRSGSTRVLRANTSYSTASPLTRLYVVTRLGSNREAPRFEGVAAVLCHAPPRCGARPPVLCHARRRPRWIPNDVHAHLLDAGLAQQALPNVLEDEVGCWGAHGAEGDVGVDDTVDGLLRTLDPRERRPETVGCHDALRCVLRNLWNST